MAKSPSLTSDSEAVVFIDTSLGTHLAVTVNQNDTVSALKRKIECEHELCFTRTGKVVVEALKVKRKGLFYHLADSMFVKNAFSGVSKNWFLSADVSDVPEKRLLNLVGSMPLLLEGNERAKEKVTIADRDGSVDSAREASKKLEMGIKHGNCSEGFKIPLTQECKEDGLRKESDVECNASLGKPLEKKRQLKSKQKNEETGNLKVNDGSVKEFGKEQSQPDIVPPENSLGNQSRDVPFDMATGNKNTTEEPCRSSASTMDNRADSRIHRTKDTSKETEVPGEHIEGIKNTLDEVASQSQPAAKKKRKFESIAGLEDSPKENNALICESNNEISKPDIASEVLLGDKQKNENAVLDGLNAESSDLVTDNSRRRKKKGRTLLNSLNQAVDAAPSARDAIEEKSVVADAGTNNKISGGDDDVASINEQGLQDDKHTTDVGNVESKNDAAEEKLDCHTPLVVKVGEERESSQRKDSEALISEEHKLSSQDNRDGNDIKVLVTSRLSDPNDTNKKKRSRKTKDSIEPHQAVHEHASDKAKEDESNITQKNGKDVSEKETGNSDFIRKTDNLDDNEMTLEQIGKPQENSESMNQNIKKKSKRKRTAVTKDLPNLQAEVQNVGNQDPAQSNSMSIESTKVPSRALEHISDGSPLEAKATGNSPEKGCSIEVDNHMEVSCEVNKVNFDKHLVPGQDEVSASSKVHAEASKAKKKRQKPDVQSNGPSSDLQRSLKSNGNQGIGGKSEAVKSSSIQPQGSISKGDQQIGGKSEAANSSSVQPQGSISKGDRVMPHPEKKSSKKVPKTGTKDPSSDTSGKKNFISEVAGKRSVADVSGTNTHARKKNEAFSVANSNLEKSNNKAHQNKIGDKSQPGVNRNCVASGKASGIDNGEVVNSSENRKTSAKSRPIFRDDSSGSSEDEDEDIGDVSKASIQTPSDYSSSSSYSNGESNAEMSTPKNGKDDGRSAMKSYSSGIKDLKWNELAKSSSTFKKAKLTASQSQLEDGDSQPEFVPDSQPVS